MNRGGSSSELLRKHAAAIRIILKEEGYPSPSEGKEGQGIGRGSLYN